MTRPAASLQAISHAELMQLPVLRYTGPIHLICSSAEREHALHELRHERVLGFDIESRPSFRKGQRHAPSLVQLAGAAAVYLFRLSRREDWPAIATVLSDPHLIKAGVALDRDIADLQRLFPFKPANMVDLGDVARSHHISQTGLRNLAGLFLGGRVTKGARTSNWAAPQLSQRQQQYAATDAWVCRELFLAFAKRGWVELPGL